jgi:hypothetical protein
MEHLNLFIAQIGVIFLPGIIWARLDARYAGKGPASEFDFVLRAFVYGVASYAVTFALYSLFRQPFTLIDFKDAQERDVLTQAIAIEIFSATAVGFALGVFWVYAANHKWLTIVLQWIGATKRYGDEDVWDYTLNSSIAAVEYAHIRDFTNQLILAGWIRTFSESGQIRELVLSEAQVFDFDGNLLYEVPLMYVARKPEDIHMEFPSGGIGQTPPPEAEADEGVEPND